MLSEDFKSEMLNEFRKIYREELEAALGEQKLVKITELPPFLTKDHLKKILHIGNTKASELLNRADFPVLREAGVLVPSHLFIKWVEQNTEWIELNSQFPKEAKSLRAI
ncbi:MAG: DNA-binding protein [Solibacillus sp.]